MTGADTDSHPFVQQLKHGNRWTRRKAAWSLDSLGWRPADIGERAYYLAAKKKWKSLTALGAAAVPPLILLLNDPSRCMRKKAVKLLNGIGGASTVEPLLHRLKDRKSIARLALEGLRRIKETGVVEPFFTALKSADHVLRRDAAAAMDRIGLTPSTLDQTAWYLAAKLKWGNLSSYGQHALPPLLNAMADEYPEIREQATAALGDVDVPEAVEPLIAALKDRFFSVQVQAIRALGKSGDPRAVQALIRVLEGDDYELQAEAAPALGKMGAVEAAPPLIRAMLDRHLHVRGVAEKALENALPYMGEAAVQHLIAALTDPVPLLRQKAAKLLGKTGNHTAFKPLIATLPDTNASVRAAAATALGELGHAEAAEPLIGKLQDESPAVRENAMWALGHLKEPRAVNHLIARLKDVSPEVRESAAALLGNFNDAGAAVEPLIDALKDKRPSVRTAAALSLGNIGDSRAVRPLLNTFSNVRRLEDHQKEAAAALREISGRLLDPDRDYVCEKCLLRFRNHSLNLAVIKFNYVAVHPGTVYSACPGCRSDSGYLEGVRTMALILDRQATEITIRDGGALLINRLKHKELCDYDEIRIIDADDFDVEELVMALRNDMDDLRRKRMPEIPVRLSPQVSLSQAKLNLLKDCFPSLKHPEKRG